jgi:two-component system C4-dicarboxylate transport response regulator DctD
LTLVPGDGPVPTSLHEQVEHFERAAIAAELRRTRGDVAATAKTLGVPKQTLYDKLRRLKLTVEGFRESNSEPA